MPSRRRAPEPAPRSLRVRRGLGRVLVLGGLMIAVLSTPTAVSAHPLGNFTVNVYAGIRLTPGEVRVDYIVDMAEIPTVQVMPDVDVDGDGIVTDAERAAWARSTAHDLASNVAVAVDGERVGLRLVAAAASLRSGQGGLDVLRLESTFAGSVGDTGELRFVDANFADRLGWREITAAGEGGTALVRSSVPAHSVTSRLRTYPTDLLASPLDSREATVSFEPGVGAQSAAGGAAGTTERPPLGSGGFADLMGRSGPLMVVALLLAFAFGALHALGPGHGKTLMAAYLVGAGGRLRHAVAVGGAVAVMHTSSVLALGFVVLTASELVAPERVYPWLGLGSGLFAFGLGAWLLVRRIGEWGGRAEPTDTHEHPHAPAIHDGRILSRRAMAALSMAGGILPSPTALVVLLASMALGRVAYGIALIAAFSLGLAAALVVVGIVALRARDAVSRRMSSRFARVLPVASASVIATMGLVLAVRGLGQI